MEPGKGFKTVVFNIKDRAGDCSVKLNSGESLGFVQAVAIEARVGGVSTAIIETICNKAEVEILQKNTELLVSVVERKDYADGYLKAKDEIYKIFENSNQKNFTLEEILTLIKE